MKCSGKLRALIPSGLASLSQLPLMQSRGAFYCCKRDTKKLPRTRELFELLGFKITVLCGICHFVFPPHPYKQKNPGTKQKLLSLCLVSGKILVSFRANIYFYVFYQRFCVSSRAKITEIYPFLKSRYFRNSFAAAARYLRSLKRNR